MARYYAFDVITHQNNENKQNVYCHWALDLYRSHGIPAFSHLLLHEDYITEQDDENVWGPGCDICPVLGGVGEGGLPGEMQCHLPLSGI